MRVDMNQSRVSWVPSTIAAFFLMLALQSQIAVAAPLAQDTVNQEALNQDEVVRLMVKRDPSVQIGERMAALSIASAANSTLSQVGWEVIEVDASRAPALMAELQATQGIVEVTPDYPLELLWDPNDPSFIEGHQWSLDKIGANVAWEFSTGEEIVVAVLDSGIDPNHPDLVGRVVTGHNFFDDSTDTTDLCGHGTHVSGIIAGATNNAIGMASVAHQAKIMPLKVIDDECKGSYSRLMQAIIYAVDQDVRILSITSGGGFEHDGLHDAIKYAEDKGVLVVVAAGNRGDDLPFYPGSFAESFTTSGTDQNDNRYEKTNYGEQIDISAPATFIYSTYYNNTDGSTYAYMSGTSMAAPHVAAVAALILAVDPKLTLAELKNALIDSATDLGEPGWDPIFGWGRVTAWRAVAAVSPAAGNVRLGHYRIPTPALFEATGITATPDADSIQLNWLQSNVELSQTVVIYRSIVPVFEASGDITELDATTTGSYSDTNVVVDQEYFYWLVQADNDVEITVSDAIGAKVQLIAQSPEESKVPEEPVPGQSEVVLFMPMVQR